MSRVNSKVLDTNDRLPDFELQLVSGETMRLPADAGDGYTVIFFYRGYF